MDKRTKNILTHAIGPDLAGLVESYLIPHWFHLHHIKTARIFKSVNKYRWFIYTVERAEKKYRKHRDILLGFKHEDDGFKKLFIGIASAVVMPDIMNTLFNIYN